MKSKNSILRILIGLSVVIIDLVVYLTLGLLSMNYDDFYDKSMGKYGSLKSMTFLQQINEFGLSFWNLINLLLMGYLTFKTIMRIRQNKTTNA